MKKHLYLALIALVALIATGCQPKVEIDPALLVGTWKAPSINGPGSLVFCFQTDECIMTDSKSYGRWGYQYDEGDDVHFSDLEYHKSGWFGYSVGDGVINIHSANDKGAYIGTAVNKVTAFDGQTMTMIDEGTSYTFKKQ